jgi:replicative DNA helicase
MSHPDRQPPYAPEAEISILGGMLIDGEAVPRALEIVDDGMFYREAHRRLFRAMAALFQRGAVIDPPSLAEYLRDAGDMEAVGGVAYIAELIDAVSSAANIGYWCDIVRNRAQRRRLIEACSNGIRDAYEPDGKTNEQIVDTVGQSLSEAVSATSGGMEWVKKILYPAFQRIEELQEAMGGITGLSTGLPALDDMTGGLQAGNLVIVAARPSMGKTAFVTGIAAHAAISEQKTVAIFSYEMSKQEVVQRLLCSEGLVDLSRLLRGRLSPDDYGRLAQAAGHLNTAPIWIEDGGSPTVLAIRSASRRLKVEQPDLGMIVVDYLQLMEGGSESENRNQEVSAITRGLKMLAKELSLPVVALSQLSRKVEERANKRPQLSDLRESGSIEQDADLVMFLYRPEYYMTAAEIINNGVAGKAELIIAKQRNGPTGDIDLYFRKECARFESLGYPATRGAA